MAADNDFDDSCAGVGDDDHSSWADDDYDADLPENLPPSAQPVLQQGMLLGPELLVGPYQRGSGRYPTLRLYDADGNEWIWQEVHMSIEDISNGATWTVTFGLVVT